LGYKNLRDAAHLIEYKKYIESLWENYKPYADEHFRSDACKHFQERFWEMYLGVTFIKHGFTINRGGDKGPEFYIETNAGRKIWIEAIAPHPGDGADAFPPLKTGVWRDAPVNEFILRLTHAIETKKKPKKGIVGSDDIYIIGINTKNIAQIPRDSELPSIVKAVYPFGNLVVVLDKNTWKIKETRHEYRDSIQKKSGSAVSTSVFLDPAYKKISAVIYSHVDCANKPGTLGADFVLVHNAIAKNKLDIGTFKFGIEYWKEKNELKSNEYKCQ
jgi:type I restriction enzyme S subunit